MANLFRHLLILVGLYVVSSKPTFSEKYGDLIHTRVGELFRRVEAMQVKKDEPFIPPLLWEKHKGMYESDIKFYFHGHLDLYLFREAFKVYDDNMFNTAWITQCLLEAYMYGNSPKPSDEQIFSSVKSIKEYHNKNLNYSNSLMTFWPQQYNETTKTWVSYPVNLHNFFELAGDFNATFLETILKDLGFADLASIMERLMKSRDGYLRAFLIPPDFDDTFVNVGLGSLLTEAAADFPQSHQQWLSQNTNLTSVFDGLKKYAYRPLSKNDAVNTIDCRTYFYLRHFLEKQVDDKQDIALVPTWIQDLNEVQTMGPKGVDMPFNINNVDATVAANGVFGITSSILSGLVDPNLLHDQDLMQIYLNTSNLLAHMINYNFSSRPDLALLYYPSAFEFYWFVARTYAELQRSTKKGPLPYPVMDFVRDSLGEVLKGTMTEAVLNASIPNGDSQVYFDDFVGDGDLDSNNKTIIRGEDRLFTTAMAINALITTWTTFDKDSRHLVWEKDVPKEVRETVEKAANFLVHNMFSFKPWNAFFSGSVKGTTTFPLYPVNRVSIKVRKSADYTNKGLTPEAVRIYGMQGVIPESAYQELLKEKWFINAPLDFHGYNGYPDYWPFWCSEAYTYVTSMLALAKVSNSVDL
ncbi:hypothetical protein CHS0354_017166 [Potamilus streckersoni]|uniref:Hexamerin n=1 Tax=Potamilus streckersoni TaxID=2493646 RepID=A0AAE0T3T9_9BIVA|nr:hypothetical protein CHS0354_017166 [Potamilus streckersoni]